MERERKKKMEAEPSQWAETSAQGGIRKERSRKAWGVWALREGGDTDIGDGVWFGGLGGKAA